MNGGIDVIEVLRNVNPVPPNTIDERDCRTAAELRVMLEAQPTEPPITLVQRATPVRTRPTWWTFAATAAAVAAGVVAVAVVAPDGPGGVAPASDTAAVDELTDPARPVIERLIHAINTQDTALFIDVFATEGTFDPRGSFADSEVMLGGQPVSQRPLVAAWLSILHTWHLEVELTSCRRIEQDHRVLEGEDGFVACDVRTRWHRLSLELAEEWQFNLRGTELTYFGPTPLVDLNPEPRELPLGYDDLEAWEAWLQRDYPDAAARYLNPRCTSCFYADWLADVAPADPELSIRLNSLAFEAANDWVIDGHRFKPTGLIPYDPQWAGQIEASIDAYLERVAAGGETVVEEPAGSFVGVWQSTDVDGSAQTMAITDSGKGEYDVHIADDVAVACAGAQSATTARARLRPDGSLATAQSEVHCDDGSTPITESSPPLSAQLANLTFAHDATTDTLTDSFGVRWRRPGTGDDAAQPTVPGDTP